MRRSVALIATVMLAVPAVTHATHARPLVATPILVSFVPAYEQCVAPDRVHGPPLALASCSGPQQTSSFLTVGTPPSAPAQSVGSLRWSARGGQPLPPDDEIVVFTVDFTDVRCQGASGACAGPGTDYSGSLEIRTTVHMTDHYNGPNGGPYTEGATVQETFTLSIPIYCTPTSDPGIGSACSVTNLYLEAVYPSDPIKEAKRTLWEAGQIQVYDGGADGDATTVADNTLFAVQGLFVP